jgi:hypothetical protein
LSVLQVFREHNRAIRQLRRGKNRRIADRQAVPLGQQQADFMSFLSQWLDAAHRADRRQDLAYLGPRHPKLAGCDRSELVEHLDADDATRDDEGFRTVRLGRIARRCR